MIKHFLKTLKTTAYNVIAFIYRIFSRVSRYTITFIVLNSTIWSIALVTITLLPERYESQWTLILPGAGVGGRMDIDSIGSASAIVNSGFSNRNLSPKVNYKSIAQSSKLIKEAALLSDMNHKDFGQPGIKFVDQTSLIFFSLSASSPELAQKKSWALYHALEKEINTLRMDEIKRREKGIQNMLKTFGEKLNKTKNELLDYQAQSNITTIEQFNRIPLLIEDMRIQLLNLTTQKEQTYEEMMTLHRILGLTSKQASQLMSLQADPLFNKLLENQATASASLAEFSNLYGDQHPEVKQHNLAYQSASKAIKNRSEQLIGKQQWLAKTSLSDNAKRNDLMYDLIGKKITYEGFKRKITQLTQQIETYQARIQDQAKSVSQLDELERAHQIAKAVFTSAVAKIDTGKSDIFASYPMIQLFMPPTLPETVSGAKPLHVYLGAISGSLLSILILIILWIRRRQNPIVLNQAVTEKQMNR